VKSDLIPHARRMFESGSSIPDIRRRLGISETTLRKWKKLFSWQEPLRLDLKSDTDQFILALNSSLEKRISRVKMELAALEAAHEKLKSLVATCGKNGCSYGSGKCDCGGAKK
jgi:transposase-like protein